MFVPVAVFLYKKDAEEWQRKQIAKELKLYHTQTLLYFSQHFADIVIISQTNNSTTRIALNEYDFKI